MTHFSNTWVPSELLTTPSLTWDLVWVTLTWVLDRDEGLDATDQYRCEVFHLFQGPDQHLPVNLVGQLLLPGVHFFGHPGQYWGQVL